MKRSSRIGIAIVLIAIMPFLAAGISTASPGGLPAGMSAQIMGYYAPYDLYVTAPSGQSSPMIAPFQLNLTSVGTTSVTVNASGAVIYAGAFTNHTVIYDNTTYAGNVNLTVTMVSSQGTAVITWKLDFMSPVTYISYVKAKVPVSVGVPYYMLGTFGVLGVFLTIIFMRIWTPGMRYRVKSKWISAGGVRHV